MSLAWTDDRVERLRTLFDRGMSANQIACEMGIPTRNAVIGKLSRLGLKRNDVTTPKASLAADKTRPKQQRVRSTPFIPPSPRKSARKQLAEIPMTVPADVSPTRIAILDATSDQCRFPAADDGSAQMVCGGHTLAGFSWCASHARIVFAPPVARRAAA